MKQVMTLAVCLGWRNHVTNMLKIRFPGMDILIQATLLLGSTPLITRGVVRNRVASRALL